MSLRRCSCQILPHAHIITYDAIGNPTTWYDGAAMTWTNGRRLATISATDDHSALSFTYDSDGLRLTKAVGTEVHKYTWQGSKLISEQYGTTTLEFFYDESGAPYAFLVRDTTPATPTEAWYYYVTNLQGDVMQILDASGNTVASYTYNAWGEILNLNNSTSANIGSLNPIRYRGYYFDSETGFYYLKSRYYDPRICRFINADGLASTGHGFVGTNMFAYCLNRPLNESDANGNIASTSLSISDTGTPSAIHKLLSSREYCIPKWYNATTDEKKQMLIALKSDIEALLGVYISSEIQFFSIPRNDPNFLYGYYSPRNFAIFINESLIDTGSPESYHLLSTVVHEMRHAYQYAVVRGMYIYGYMSPYSVDRQIMISWDWNIDHYISPGADYDAYYSQPIEVDARAFANQR